MLMKMEEDAAQLSAVFEDRDLPADLSSAEKKNSSLWVSKSKLGLGPQIPMSEVVRQFSCPVNSQAHLAVTYSSAPRALSPPFQRLRGHPPGTETTDTRYSLQGGLSCRKQRLAPRTLHSDDRPQQPQTDKTDT